MPARNRDSVAAATNATVRSPGGLGEFNCCARGPYENGAFGRAAPVWSHGASASVVEGSAGRTPVTPRPFVTPRCAAELGDFGRLWYEPVALLRLLLAH